MAEAVVVSSSEQKPKWVVGSSSEQNPVWVGGSSSEQNPKLLVGLSSEQKPKWLYAEEQKQKGSPKDFGAGSVTEEKRQTLFFNDPLRGHLPVVSARCVPTQVLWWEEEESKRLPGLFQILQPKSLVQYRPASAIMTQLREKEFLSKGEEERSRDLIEAGSLEELYRAIPWTIPEEDKSRPSGPRFGLFGPAPEQEESSTEDEEESRHFCCCTAEAGDERYVVEAGSFEELYEKRRVALSEAAQENRRRSESAQMPVFLFGPAPEKEESSTQDDEELTEKGPLTEHANLRQRCHKLIAEEEFSQDLSSLQEELSGAGSVTPAEEQRPKVFFPAGFEPPPVFPFKRGRVYLEFGEKKGPLTEDKCSTDAASCCSPSGVCEINLPDGALEEHRPEFVPLCLAYERQMRQSHCFDIDVHPGSCSLGDPSVMPLLPSADFNSKAHLLNELANRAVQKFNEEESNVYKYGVLKIEKVNFSVQGTSYQYWMTVKVLNLTLASPIQTFQVHAALEVLNDDNEEDEELIYCFRPKEEPSCDVCFGELRGKDKPPEELPGRRLTFWDCDDAVPKGASKERRGEFRGIYERYFRQLWQSDGFDVDVYPGDCISAPYIPYLDFEKEANMLWELANHAIQDYNNRETSVYKYTVSYIEKVNLLLMEFREFFMTVKVVNLTLRTPLETFQIRAYKGPHEENIVILCRKKVLM